MAGEAQKVGFIKRGYEATKGFVGRHKWGTAIAAAVALGTAYFTMRNKRKELPTQEELTPLNALATPEFGPADGRAANEWQNRVRGGAQIAGPNQPTVTGAQDLSRA